MASFYVRYKAYTPYDFMDMASPDAVVNVDAFAGYDDKRVETRRGLRSPYPVVYLMFETRTSDGYVKLTEMWDRDLRVDKLLDNADRTQSLLHVGTGLRFVATDESKKVIAKYFPDAMVDENTAI